MPPVPKANREVQAQLTPTPYIEARVNADTSGANVARVYEGLGVQMQHIGYGLLHLKERYDETKMYEFANEIANLEQRKVRSKEEGFLYKTGKDVMGQSQQFMEDWDVDAKKIRQKYNFVGNSARRADSFLNEKTRRIQEGVEKHDYDESEKWNNAVYQDTLANVYKDASFYRNDPAGLQKTRANLNATFRVMPSLQKLDPEMRAIAEKQMVSQFHEAVLDSLLADNSLKAKQYYEENKNEISYQKQPDYIAKIDRMDTIYTARDNAQQLAILDPMDAYSKIDNIKDIQLRDATESEYNRILRQNEIAQKETDRKISNEIIQRVYSAYDNGQDISEIMREVNLSPMSLEQKEKIYKNLKTMQELEGVGNNWADYNILLDMHAYNNEEFKNVNLAEYNLTKEQYNKMTELQRAASENKYSSEAVLREAIDKVSGFNFVTQNDLSKREYENELIRFLSKVERMQGAAFDYKNPYQLESILAGFEYKDAVAKDKNLDETKELFTRAKKRGEVYEVMAREYMLFKGQNKREPSPDEIYEMAKRSHATIENNWRRTDKGKFDAAYGIYYGIQNTLPKEGETKILTYYADTRIPEISKELGFDLRVTSRYRKGDSGGHGQGRKCDIGMNGLNAAQRMRAFERLLQEPAIASIGTSDPILLKKYNNPKNGKIRDLREYDANYRKTHPNTTMNHVNHFDVSFNLKYNEKPQYSTPRLI